MKKAEIDWCEMLESASDEGLLRALHARGTTLRQCTDLSDMEVRCERVAICRCGSTAEHHKILKMGRRNCLCPRT
jgi:hypothetical protein